jgi:thiamine kinase-like enzyme
MTRSPDASKLRALLKLQGRALRLESIPTGGNNRVFKLTGGKTPLLAKWYFSHPADSRNRLEAEFAFLTCAKQAAIECVPQPVACDPAHMLGVYEFVEGRKLAPGEIDWNCIERAAEFFLRLNHPSTHEFARLLGNASEACFSVAEHFAMVEDRIDRLRGICGNSGVDREAREFSDVLSGRWQRIKSVMLKAATLARIDLEQPIAERCVSPSDFGFHNALATPSRGLCFIDFEYAGWDDPAKLAGDFFSHPAVPVDSAYFERFLGVAMSYATRPDRLATRARILFPVFQTKWCCIMLNEFLPDSARRRRFADPTFDEVSRKKEQLAKAIALMERIAA